MAPDATANRSPTPRTAARASPNGASTKWTTGWKADQPRWGPCCQPSRSTLNQAKKSPVLTLRKAKKATTPSGASSGATADRNSRRARMAMAACHASAGTRARAVGRQAVASAASTPARTQRRRRAARRLPADSASIRASV